MVRRYRPMKYSGVKTRDILPEGFTDPKEAKGLLDVYEREYRGGKINFKDWARKQNMTMAKLEWLKLNKSSEWTSEEFKEAKRLVNEAIDKRIEERRKAVGGVMLYGGIKKYAPYIGRPLFTCQNCNYRWYGAKLEYVKGLPKCPRCKKFSNVIVVARGKLK